MKTVVLKCDEAAGRLAARTGDILAALGATPEEVHDTLYAHTLPFGFQKLTSREDLQRRVRRAVADGLGDPAAGVFPNRKFVTVWAGIGKFVDVPTPPPLAALFDREGR